MKPRSIAVVGASRSPNTIGHQILANIVRHGFTGPVVPVNPTDERLPGAAAGPSILAAAT
ncbi:MAG: CoA-binding protein [Gemmatimonadaceae bacterium]